MLLVIWITVPIREPPIDIGHLNASRWSSCASPPLLSLHQPAARPQWPKFLLKVCRSGTAEACGGTARWRWIRAPGRRGGGRRPELVAAGGRTSSPGQQRPRVVMAGGRASSPNGRAACDGDGDVWMCWRLGMRGAWPTFQFRPTT